MDAVERPVKRRRRERVAKRRRVDNNVQERRPIGNHVAQDLLVSPKRTTASTPPIKSPSTQHDPVGTVPLDLAGYRPVSAVESKQASSNKRTKRGQSTNNQRLERERSSPHQRVKREGSSPGVKVKRESSSPVRKVMRECSLSVQNIKREKGSPSRKIKEETSSQDQQAENGFERVGLPRDHLELQDNKDNLQLKEYFREPLKQEILEWTIHPEAPTSPASLPAGSSSSEGNCFGSSSDDLDAWDAVLESSSPAAYQEPPRPPLCPEQQRLVDLILSGRNVFYTGSAGCGKSYVLETFIRALKDKGRRVSIIAPTGRAALNVGGTTIWSYAGWVPDDMKKGILWLEKKATSCRIRKRLKETDVLVIDEISMVENHNLERLNFTMQHARHAKNRPDQPSDKPFGGVQVIVTGDFCQLPPIKPFSHCMVCGFEHTSRADFSYSCKNPKCKTTRRYYDHEKWAFQSNVWAKANFAYFILTKIHRQSDQAFIQLLQRCRMGEPFTSAEERWLLNHPCDVAGAMKLFPRRYDVERVNSEEFRKLKTRSLQYSCFDDFRSGSPQNVDAQSKSQRVDIGPLKGTLAVLADHPYSPIVELKQGMLVVLLINLDIHRGLVNGSQGAITGFLQAEKPSAPDKKTDNLNGDVWIRYHNVCQFWEAAKDKEWPVVEFFNGQTVTISPSCMISELGEVKPYALMSRTQIPLAPAWALTIHKSQGMTLDRVIIDLSKSFEQGQMYVALSRARSLNGLKVMGLGRVEIGANEQVKRFLEEKFGKKLGK